MSNELTRRKVQEAVDALDQIRKQRQVNSFIKDMRKMYRTHRDLFPPHISRSSIFRILSMKNDIDLLHEKQDASLRAVSKYLDAKKLLNDFDPSLQARIEFAQNYFRTKYSRYGAYSLRNLAGNYDMYRRFWRARDKNLFMRSRVKIKHFKRGHYLMFERQNWLKDDFWPQEKYQEIDRGFLFPSGQSIISVSEAMGKEDGAAGEKNTKFYSINDFEPPLEVAHTVNSFSGSAIASSDTPPHLGFGFHCVRSNNVKKFCEIVDIRDIKQDILKKILLNENYVIERFSEVDQKIDSIRKNVDE